MSIQMYTVQYILNLVRFNPSYRRSLSVVVWTKSLVRSSRSFVRTGSARFLRATAGARCRREAQESVLQGRDLGRAAQGLPTDFLTRLAQIFRGFELFGPTRASRVLSKT